MAFRDFWFSTADAMLPSERTITVFEGVALYEEKRILFEKGSIKLTNQRLLYVGPQVFFMSLDKILSVTYDPGSWTKSEKVLLAVSSDLSFRLSFRAGGAKDFQPKLEAAIKAKEWLYGVARKGYGIGLEGIQKQLAVKAQRTEIHITSAFEDLSNLMASAKEMVELSKKLMTKSKDKGFTDDETAQFRSQLLSIGLQNSDSKSDNHLEQEIGRVLLPAVEASSGIISLPEAYCRVNRARGLNLLSPEDLLSTLEHMKHPIKLYTFPSGLRVVQLSSLDESAWMEKILSDLNEVGCLTAEQLASRSKLSAALALERLLKYESDGKLCRDESMNGLVFYPNRFREEYSY